MVGRIIRWSLIVLSVVAYQGLFAEYLAPRGTGLRWDVLVVLLAGMIGGTTRGMLAGGIIGFVTDCLVPEYLGWGIMVKATLGGVMGMSREHLFMERFVARWLILALGIAAHEVMYLLPVSGFDLARYFHTLAVSTTISVAVTSVVGIGLLLLWHLMHHPAPLLSHGMVRDTRQS